MSSFRELISIGFDKNGEADFRITMTIQDLDERQMKELRAMMPIACSQAIYWWSQRPAGLERMQACRTEPAALNPSQKQGE